MESRKIKWPFVLAVTICLSGAIYAIYSWELRKNFEVELQGCSDLWPLNNHINNEESVEYSRLRTFCKQKNISALNTAVSIGANEIEFTCQPQKTSFLGSELATAVLSIHNISNRRLLLLDGKLERLTRKSYESKGFVQDDYLFDGNYPAQQLSIINPSETLRVPATFNVDSKGVHRINISLAVPSWTSLAGNMSQVQQIAVTSAACQFEQR